MRPSELKSSIISSDDQCDNLFHKYIPQYREPFVAKEGKLRAKSMPKRNWGKTSFVRSTFGIVPRGLIPDPSEDSDHSPSSPRIRDGNRPLSSDRINRVSITQQGGGHLAKFDENRVFKANPTNKKLKTV